MTGLDLFYAYREEIFKLITNIPVSWMVVFPHKYNRLIKHAEKATELEIEFIAYLEELERKAQRYDMQGEKKK